MNNLIELKNNFCEIKSNKIKSQLIPKGFGFLENNILKLDLFETLYLFENKKINIDITHKDLIKKSQKEIKNFDDKYLVFKDFRDKGYILKDGAIFGFDFRVYEKTKNNKHDHTKYVIDVKRTHKDNITKIIKSERLANSINLKFILAIIDNENKVLKIKMERFT